MVAAVAATVTGGPDGGGNELDSDPTKAAQIWGGLYGAAATHVGSTEFDFLYHGKVLAFTGTGMGAFDANGMPHSGHITGLSVTDATTGELTTSWQNISLNVTGLLGYIADAHNGDLTAVPTMLSKLFAGNDHFVSTHADPSNDSDTFVGEAGNDIFDLQQSREGTEADGGAGADVFNFGGALKQFDHVDGGDGQDVLNLDGGNTGDHSPYFQPMFLPIGWVPPPVVNPQGLFLNPDSLTNIEKVVMAGGSSYGFALQDANVLAGKTMTFDASALGANDQLYIDAVMVTSGRLDVIGGAGDDIVRFSSGGETFTRGAGNDSVIVGFGLSADDRLDGGTGTDQLILNGDYSGLVLAPTTVVNFETLKLTGQHNYNITTADGTVAAGQTLTVLAGGLPPNKSVTFDGHKETDGSFNITGGAGADHLTGGLNADTINGGGGDDIITGGRGGDTLTGGPGVDTFHFNGPLDSTVAAPDLITDFTHTDRIDLSAIDADTTTGGDQAFHMGATAGHAGDIQFHYDGTNTVVDLYTHHNTVIGAEFLLAGNIALTASDFIL